ncbi:MAG: hypothetical protein RLZZ387_5595 [Chloroflexota bacterium]|jgi:hypothetical protein
MTSDEGANVCPNCARPDAVRTVREAASDELLSHKLSAPRSPRHHGRSLGCASLLVSTLAGLTAGAVVGILVMAVGMDVPGRPNIGLADSGVFSAILVFMVVFIGVYAFFVWRQARADSLLQHQVARWHRAHTRWEQLSYCSRCDGVFIPGQPRLVPAGDLHPYLYQHERPAAANTPAAAAQ